MNAEKVNANSTGCVKTPPYVITVDFHENDCACMCSSCVCVGGGLLAIWCPVTCRR